jgi:hypothetical protein
MLGFTKRLPAANEDLTLQSYKKYIRFRLFRPCGTASLPRDRVHYYLGPVYQTCQDY